MTEEMVTIRTGDCVSKAPINEKNDEKNERAISLK